MAGLLRTCAKADGLPVHLGEADLHVVGVDVPPADEQVGAAHGGDALRRGVLPHCTATAGPGHFMRPGSNRPQCLQRGSPCAPSVCSSWGRETLHSLVYAIERTRGTTLSRQGRSG